MVNKCKCMHLTETLRNQGATWPEVAEKVNELTGNKLSSSAYRMAFYEWNKSKDSDNEEVDGQITWWDSNPADLGKCMVSAEEAAPFGTIGDKVEDDFTSQLLELKIQKMQAADYRTEVNRMYRRMAREESIKDIAREAAEMISKEKPFLKPTMPEQEADKPDRAAVLCLTDWHYGSCQDSFYNKYNPDICKERLNKLVDEVIHRLDRNGFNFMNDLYIVNLGDLINGLIHAQIRINNRIDVITQIMEVSEILAEIINKFAMRYRVHYVSTMDNHSRVMPDKKDSIDLESLCRITDWYVKERCKDLDIVYEQNIYADDIATFEVLGHNVAAAHGDKDKPSNIIKNLTVHTRKPYDMMLSAHRHHPFLEEDNECVLICNGALMGTDDYAQSLRMSSKASQTLIISTYDNVIEQYHRIVLN